MYHVGARAYDPRTARWLQRDPIDAASGDPNLYRYCGNEPLGYQDPEGLRSANKKRWGRKNCEDLARKIKNLIKSLSERISKYDREADKQPHPFVDRETGKTCYTQPYGHYRKISEELNALQERLQQWYDHCDGPDNNDIRPDISKANELLQWNEPIPYPGYTGWIPPALGGGFYEPGLIDMTPIMAGGIAGAHLAASGTAGGTAGTTTVAAAANSPAWKETIAAALSIAAEAVRRALRSFGPILGW